MNSKQTVVRALGQRSITSSFLPRSSNPFKKEELDNKLDMKKNSPVSLSDFLERKLHKSFLLPKTVQGKSCPFLTPVGPRNPDVSSDGQISVEEKGEEKRINVLDKLIFEQFKHSSNDGDTVCSCSTDEVETPNKDDVKQSTKRKNPFEGADKKHTTRKPFLVLGDNPNSKWKPKGMGASSKRNEKTKPAYNHYANGCGWWDYNMEGVDNEEVGYGEVWEGVGSTTFGGIEWH